jgi:hypothetical protein
MYSCTCRNFVDVLNLFSLEIFVTFYRFFIPTSTGNAVTVGTAVDVPRPAAGTHACRPCRQDLKHGFAASM